MWLSRSHTAQHRETKALSRSFLARGGGCRRAPRMGPPQAPSPGPTRRTCRSRRATERHPARWHGASGHWSLARRGAARARGEAGEAEKGGGLFGVRKAAALVKGAQDGDQEPLLVALRDEGGSERREEREEEGGWRRCWEKEAGHRGRDAGTSREMGIKHGASGGARGDEGEWGLG